MCHRVTENTEVLSANNALKCKEHFKRTPVRPAGRSAGLRGVTDANDVEMNPRITVYIHVSCPSGQPWAVQIRIQSNLVCCISFGLRTVGFMI